jgi:3',5'-cyclic AMP phosphodiesterase CpdA
VQTRLPNGDWHTLKYTPDGRQAWVITFDGELEYDEDAPTDLLVDRTGNVYVVGSAYLFPGDSRYATQDIVLIKYRQTPAGDVDGDGCVDDADLLAVLGDFGRQETGLATDLNRDGIVNDADLLLVMFDFGSGC